MSTIRSLPAPQSYNQQAMQGVMDNLVAQMDTLIPVGGIILFGGIKTPAGFLPCDGSDVSRGTYAGLFGIIGVVFGAGDGSTTFTLPDLTPPSDTKYFIRY